MLYSVEVAIWYDGYWALLTEHFYKTNQEISTKTKFLKRRKYTLARYINKYEERNN